MLRLVVDIFSSLCLQIIFIPENVPLANFIAQQGKGESRKRFDFSRQRDSIELVKLHMLAFLYSSHKLAFIDCLCSTSDSNAIYEDV